MIRIKVRVLYTISMVCKPSKSLHSISFQTSCRFVFDHRSKLHAPKEVCSFEFRFSGEPIGGGPENGRRSGTTNTSGIMSLDAALSFMKENNATGSATCLDANSALPKTFYLSFDDAELNGPSVDSDAPHTVKHFV